MRGKLSGMPQMKRKIGAFRCLCASRSLHETWSIASNGRLLHTSKISRKVQRFLNKLCGKEELTGRHFCVHCIEEVQSRYPEETYTERQPGKTGGDQAKRGSEGTEALLAKRQHLSEEYCFRNMSGWRKMKVEALLIDLSGTIHIEDTVIPGSVENLQRLRNTNIKLKFVTNTTKESKRALHERLERLGFGIKKEEIFTSLTAARQLVERKQVRPMLFLEDSAKEDFEGINTEDPNAVLIGLAPSLFNYEPLNEAFRLLINGADLIAIHKARYYKTKTGLNLGPGMFVTGLESVTDKKAEVVGKPEKTFFLEALKDLDCKPENTIMIGDDARDDVVGAMEAGMKGILVQTGKYREGDEQTFSKRPLTTVKDFPAAVDFILNLGES